MHRSLLSSLFLCLLVIGFSEAGLLRTKRQDWNFPGAVDNGGNDVQRPPQRPPQPPPQRPPQPPPQRPPQTPPPVQPTQPPVQVQPTRPPQTPETVTLPESGVVFAAPCSRCMTTPQYNPVCGSDSRTYANQGILECSSFCGINVQMARLGVCQTPR